MREDCFSGGCADVSRGAHYSSSLMFSCYLICFARKGSISLALCVGSEKEKRCLRGIKCLSLPLSLSSFHFPSQFFKEENYFLSSFFFSNARDIIARRSYVFWCSSKGLILSPLPFYILILTIINHVILCWNVTVIFYYRSNDGLCYFSLGLLP